MAIPEPYDDGRPTPPPRRFRTRVTSFGWEVIDTRDGMVAGVGKVSMTLCGLDHLGAMRVADDIADMLNSQEHVTTRRARVLTKSRTDELERQHYAEIASR